MKNLEWNPFKNKTVALVGNASLSYTTEQIEQLEKHDLVCRINDGVFIDKYKHLGTKVDIGFFAHTWKWNFNGLNCDICVVTELPSSSKDVRVQILIAKHNRNPQKNVAYHYIPKWSSEEIGIKLGKNCVPSSGAHILNFLTYTELKHLSIYNFDWKQTPSFYDKEIKTYPHDFKAEKEYFLPIIEAAPNWVIV